MPCCAKRKRRSSDFGILFQRLITHRTPTAANILQFVARRKRLEGQTARAIQEVGGEFWCMFDGPWRTFLGPFHPDLRKTHTCTCDLGLRVLNLALCQLFSHCLNTRCDRHQGHFLSATMMWPFDRTDQDCGMRDSRFVPRRHCLPSEACSESGGANSLIWRIVGVVLMAIRQAKL